jgi:hypothetical protein
MCQCVWRGLIVKKAVVGGVDASGRGVDALVDFRDGGSGLASVFQELLVTSGPNRLVPAVPGKKPIIMAKQIGPT